MKTPATFEETYPQYPFADLVRIVLVLGRLLQSSRTQDPAAAVSRGLPA